MPTASRSQVESPILPRDSIRPTPGKLGQAQFVVSRDSLKAVAQALRVRFRTIVTLDGTRSSRT